MQFGQEVAVCKRELVPVQEASAGALLGAVSVGLVRQGAAKVVVQLLQGFGQAFLQSWRQTAEEASMRDTLLSLQANRLLNV